MAEKLEQSSEPVRDAVARRKSADKTDKSAGCIRIGILAKITRISNKNS